MGSPELFYKKMLQNLAYSLACSKSETLAEQICESQDIDELEMFIYEWRNNVSNNMFFFNAGQASETVICDVATNWGNDALNACAGSLCDFMDFLGIYDESEVDE